MRKPPTTVLDELIPEEKKEKAEIVERRRDFSEVDKALSSDINHTDSRMAQIQGYITALDVTVSKTKNALVNESDSSKRSKLYGVMNQTLELIATFESLYLKAMEIKHRYRKEQSVFLLSKVKLLEIELRKLESDDAAGLNTPKLVEMINSLQSMLESGGESGGKNVRAVSKEIGSIIDLEDDPKYRL